MKRPRRTCKRMNLLAALKKLRRLIAASNQASITDRERRLLSALALQTAGFGKDSDFIGMCQLAPLAGLPEKKAQTAWKRLETRGLVGAEGGGLRRGHAARRWIRVEALISPQTGGSKTGQVNSPQSGSNYPPQSGGTPGGYRGRGVKHALSRRSNNDNHGGGSLKLPPVNGNGAEQPASAEEIAEVFDGQPTRRRVLPNA